MLDLTDPIYSDETAARRHLEEIRWADGAYCPHCGDLTNVKALGGASVKKGLWHCGSCRKKFTVTVGTVFERSHIPLTKWLAAFHLMCSSKKGISAHQVHRMLNVTYKSAWFMCHRIRKAMERGGMDVPPLGGKGKHVEADETFIGRKAGAVKGRGGFAHKRTVLSLVERGGEVRSFHIDSATVAEVVPHMRKHLDIESTLNTDEAKRFIGIGRTFKGGHQSVDHSVQEYARDTAHTNTLEGYFSILEGHEGHLPALRRAASASISR